MRLFNCRADSILYHSSCDATFTIMQNSKVVDSGRLSSRFLKKVQDARHGTSKKSMYEALNTKPKVQRRPQKVRDASNTNRQGNLQDMSGVTHERDHDSHSHQGQRWGVIQDLWNLHFISTCP